MHKSVKNCTRDEFLKIAIVLFCKFTFNKNAKVSGFQFGDDDQLDFDPWSV